MKHEITAKRLRSALENANLRAIELSERSGVSQSSISQYLAGSHAPSNISSGKMAKVLGCDPVWLMGFDVSIEKKITGRTTEENENATYQKMHANNTFWNYAEMLFFMPPYAQEKVYDFIDMVCDQVEKKKEADSAS